MSNIQGNNGGRFYSNATRPVLIDCNFIVDQTNSNGFGIRSLKGQGVQNVYMATSAYMTGTTHTGTNVIDSISTGTSSLVVGMPITGNGIPAGQTIASITSSSAITCTLNNTTGHASLNIDYTGVGNPLPLTVGTNSGMNAAQTQAIGYIWVQLACNYNRYLGGFSGYSSPLVASSIKIDATDAALTVGEAYVVISPGVGPKGAGTIAPVADSSGSLAGAYFTLPDGYGQVFTVYYIVNGVGAAPNLPGTILVPINLATNASADTITTALSTALTALPATASGVYSFTASGGGTATLTYTSTVTQPLPGPAADGTIATGATFALTVTDSNLADWQAVGLPKGLVPTTGQAFIAKATGAGGSTGTVYAVGTAGSSTGTAPHIEVVGDPNQTFRPAPQGGSPNVGGWILMQCLAPAATISTDLGPDVLTAPANNTVVGLCFYVDATDTASNYNTHGN